MMLPSQELKAVLLTSKLKTQQEINKKRAEALLKNVLASLDANYCTSSIEAKKLRE